MGAAMRKCVARLSPCFLPFLTVACWLLPGPFSLPAAAATFETVIVDAVMAGDCKAVGDIDGDREGPNI